MRHVAYDVTQIGTWACWGVIAAAWVAGAALGSGEKPADGGQRRRDLASLAGVVLAAIAMSTPETLWRPLTDGSLAIRGAGLAVLVVGSACTIWARIALGSMWSSAVLVKDEHSLRTDGPYAVTRHPIYTGVLGMLLGTALTQGLGRWAALLIAVTVILLIKARAEERLLSSEFPGIYEQYRRQVPLLIPGARRAHVDMASAETSKRT
jgi:protein-S-isoprenylcysteine O-methyltransferase Ste14